MKEINKKLDDAYLNRPLIENMNYTINDNEIKIQCNHTLYVNVHKINKIDRKELLDLYIKVYREAKRQGIKIGRGGYKRYIIENWAKYEEMIKETNILYDKIHAKAKKVEQRGIHKGTNDDAVINEMTKYVWRYNPYFYRNSIISKMQSILFHLKKIENELKIKGNEKIHKIFI